MESGNTLPIPITDEQAKMVQEALKCLSGTGAFIKECLGTVPQDLVGLLGGDYVRARRAENIAKLMMKTKERLEQWRVIEHEPASLSVALPILRAAADESREELQDLWARLLAAAIDPSRAGSVRQKFTEVLSKMDPIDALVLANNRSLTYQAVRVDMLHQLGISDNQLEVTLENLNSLKIANMNCDLYPLGRELLQVIMDIPSSTGEDIC